MQLLVIGFLTAIAFWIVMMKMGIGKFVRLGWKADLVISGVMAALFFGTFSGMVTGIIAGIFLSLFLSVAKIIGRLSAPSS